LIEEKQKEQGNIVFTFHPTINPISQKIMEKAEEDALSRTYNWQTQRDDKIKDLAEQKREEEEQELKNQTQKLNFTNSNVFAVSKVKQFVESYRNESYTQSFKKDYKTGQTQALSPVHQRVYATGPVSNSLEKKPIQAQKEPLMNFINLIQKDAHTRAEVISAKLLYEVK
jgi:hypothetical protein